MKTKAVLELSDLKAIAAAAEAEALRNYLDVFGPKKGGETNG